MPLDSHGHGGWIEPVGPISDPAPAPAGPKGKHLPEGIEEQVHLPGLEVPLQHLWLGVGHLPRKPLAPGCRLPHGPGPRTSAPAGQPWISVRRLPPFPRSREAVSRVTGFTARSSVPLPSQPEPAARPSRRRSRLSIPQRA